MTFQYNTVRTIDMDKLGEWVKKHKDDTVEMFNHTQQEINTYGIKSQKEVTDEVTVKDAWRYENE